MDCTGLNLPEVKADFCSPNTNFGQIDKLYLGVSGNPMADWSDLAEWTARLDNTTLADATKIRELHVIGDKPAAEKNKVDFSKGRSVYTEATHTINFAIDETGDENYDLVKFFEDNAGVSIPVWYQAGKYLYGGNSGVSATIVINDVIPQSDEELNTFVGTITFKGGHPDRILNPMA